MRKFLLVGDSKLISFTNLKAFVDGEITFIAPAPKTYEPASVLAACDLADTVAVDYVADRDTDKPAEQRGTLRVSEDTMIVTGPRKADPSISLRRVFVYSSARATAAAHAREKKLDRPRDDLERLGRGLGSRHYPDAAAVSTRIAQIGRERKVKAYLIATVATTEAAKPTMQWTFDQTAIEAEAATDGWYALVTNIDPERRRRRRDPAPLQRTRSRRTPLRNLQRPPRRGPHIGQIQPAPRSPHHRHLPGPY